MVLTTDTPMVGSLQLGCPGQQCGTLQRCSQEISPPSVTWMGISIANSKMKNVQGLQRKKVSLSVV